MPSEFWIKMALASFINQWQRDCERYEQTCNRNKSNGLKGGRPHKNPNNPMGSNETQKTHSVISKPKKADNDNDNESDTDLLKDHNDVLRKLWYNKIWLESLAMLWKKEIKEIQEHLNKFRLECISKEDFKSNEKDAKEHFVNWTKYNPIPEPQGYVYKRPDLSSLERNPF